MIDKIKCIVTKNGTIVPIHQIIKISPKNCSHCIWTAIDGDSLGLDISNEQYDALLGELQYIGSESIYDIPNRSTFVESQTIATRKL